MSESHFIADALRSRAAELFRGDDRLVAVGLLLDLGWNELATEELESAISTLAEEQGRLLGVSRLLELAMLAAAPSLAPVTDAALVFPLRPLTGAAFDAGSEADGVVLADGRDTPTFCVAVRDGDEVGLHRVEAAAALVEAADGLDPSAQLTRVRVRTATPVVVLGAEWEAAVAMGWLALAHELVGVTEAMLDLAVRHVRERHQFGVPVGSFQAVQHRLADVAVELTAARSLCRIAWLDRGYFACAAARSAAGRAFWAASEHCHQVTGAMGSTWEYPLHQFQRRGILLDHLLDPAQALRAAVSTVVATQNRPEVLDVSRLLSQSGQTIAGGTSDVQRNIPGQRVLGLPR